MILPPKKWLNLVKGVAYKCDIKIVFAIVWEKDTAFMEAMYWEKDCLFLEHGHGFINDNDCSDYVTAVRAKGTVSIIKNGVHINVNAMYENFVDRHRQMRKVWSK